MGLPNKTDISREIYLGLGMRLGLGGLSSWPHPLPDDDALVLTVNKHVPIHVVGEGIDVGGIFILGLR